MSDMLLPGGRPRTNSSPKICRSSSARLRSRVRQFAALALLCLCSSASPHTWADSFGHWSEYLDTQPPTTATRPLALAAQLPEGPLRSALESCTNPMAANDFSIAHRGAPALFPEHTRESYLAAINQGAGTIECDVTFTSDGELVCRHAQCDLHRTTNILETPLREKCRTPFTGASGLGPATVACCASDLTLTEFRSLCGKHDSADPSARTARGYMLGNAPRSTAHYPGCGTLMTLNDSIALIESAQRKHTPELKAADEALPMSQPQYAQKLIDSYRAQGVAPERVFPQSFIPEDVAYWLRAEPEFGRQAVLLDSRDKAVDRNNPQDPGKQGAGPTFGELRAMGLNYLAPPIWYLLRSEQGEIVASNYAIEAKAAGLELIAWSLERSGPIPAMLAEPQRRGYYYQSILDALHSDADILNVLDKLATDVGVSAVFSDWPETTTVYGNCVLNQNNATD